MNLLSYCDVYERIKIINLYQKFLLWLFFISNVFALGCYYYTIANISPKYRSSLKAIFILCLVESPILIQYGHDKILETAVNDIKKLEEVNISG